MKSLIIIVSLLVSTEIQFSLCSPSEDNKLTIKDDDSEDNPLAVSNQNGLQVSDIEINKSDEGDQSQVLPDLFTSVSSKPLVAPNEEKKNEGESPTSVDEIKRGASARFDNAIKNAELALEKVRANVESVKEEAQLERKEALKKIDEQFRKAESIAAVVGRRASKKFADAKQLAKEEYNLAKSAANEKFKNAVNEYNATLEAADEEFEKIRGQIEENKSKVESEHQEALEKARKEKDVALGLAKEKKDQAEDKYKKARRGKRRISREEREKIENEYQEELYKYDEAVELAENEWQKVLDNLGIGSQFQAAEEEALKKLEQAQEKAESILQTSSEEYEKTKEKAKMKKKEATRLAKAARSKAEDDCDDIIEKAEKQQNITTKKIWAKWKKIQAQANEELKKAHAEFLQAKDAAINEYKNALQAAAEMEGKLTKEMNIGNMTPEKNIERKTRRLSTTRRRSSSKKPEEMT